MADKLREFLSLLLMTVNLWILARIILEIYLRAYFSYTHSVEEVEQTDVKDLKLPPPDILSRVNSVMSGTTHNRIPLINGARRPSEERHELDLIERYVCQRCHSRPRQILFLTCYHFYSCETCAEETEECQRCQQQILRRENIYRS
ncbi:uncharacterized protein LOC132729555 [Ruditapes philippinarum]|uniref:uncharacterized protein LOC132729555 n=1 Tax=Ruditapes philippinarum TaxID=129788 RepID=UPI00295AE505|nr:uncharacterized protein LOC132729555 [Ruditapes philippinarum]